MDGIRAIEGQSVLDICIKQFGTVEALFAFASGNGLALDAVLEGGQDLVEVPFTADIAVVNVVSETAPLIKFITISEGQNLLDLAIQETGSIEGLFDLVAFNDLVISDFLAAGQVLKFSENLINEPDFVEYFSKKQQRINTGNYTNITIPVSGMLEHNEAEHNEAEHN